METNVKRTTSRGTGIAKLKKGEKNIRANGQLQKKISWGWKNLSKDRSRNEMRIKSRWETLQGSL